MWNGYSGSCWGYDFHWQARYANFPAGHPTVVATGFVTHALFTVWKHYGLEQARHLILDAASFVLRDLNRTPHGDMFCWSYSPSDHQEVLNATMKGARLVAQAVSLGGDTDWLDDAKAPREEYRIADQVLYLHAPDGIGRSKLARNAERYLGVVATARNLRTVHKLSTL